MCKKTCFPTLVITLLLFFSCVDDNAGYKEYYHPMGNNPVQVYPWLVDIRKSFGGNRAIISQYTLYEVKYITAQVYYDEATPSARSPYTIYEDKREKKITYFHSDDVLVSEQEDIYEDFIENAKLEKVLWDNMPKHSYSK